MILRRHGRSVGRSVNKDEGAHVDPRLATPRLLTRNRRAVLLYTLFFQECTHSSPPRPSLPRRLRHAGIHTVCENDEDDR